VKITFYEKSFEGLSWKKKFAQKENLKISLGTKTFG